MMNFYSPISRKNFLKGSLALTAGLLWGDPQAFAASTEYPHSPEEATGETAMHYLFDRTPIEPAQVFDNLFYIGSISVAQFVVRTSEGLIMIDSGWDEQDADYAAASMKKLGLSPADTNIFLVLTPGHTPGCLSMIVPVTDHGEKHHVAIWGGTGTPANLEMNYLYLSAVNYFAKYTADFQVDVEMSAHGWVDDTFPRLEKLKHRRPGQPHPFVIGQKKYRKYEDVFRKMAQEAIKKYQP